MTTVSFAPEGTISMATIVEELQYAMKARVGVSVVLRKGRQFERTAVHDIDPDNFTVSLADPQVVGDHLTRCNVNLGDIVSVTLTDRAYPA
jgi:hypothetical protein